MTDENEQPRERRCRTCLDTGTVVKQVFGSSETYRESCPDCPRTPRAEGDARA